MKMLMEMDLDTEVELSPVAKAEAAMCSPYSSPSTAVLLQRRVVAWATETGAPATVRVRVGDRTLDLHKDPLMSKCRYFSEALLHSSEVELPASFPGGSEAFEAIALSCYGDDVALDPFNVAAVRCAAEFADLPSLGARCDLYINQAVLQSWDDALIVLQRCQPLLPAAEELLIVSRCVESLAFMACMEILDPEQRRAELPGAATRALVGRRWDAELVKELAARDLWVKDLIALPLAFFARIVRALRRQGMREKYVSPVVLFYANKWVLSEKTHRFWASATDDDDVVVVDGESDANRRAAEIMQGVVDLLPVEAAAAIPVAFYFALLSRSLALELTDESRARLREQVVSNLPFARVDDLPLPKRQETGKLSVADSREVKAVESIVSSHVKMQRRGADAVAELWDRYLVHIAGDSKLRPERLVELISVVPTGDRKTHDHLYNAINTYLVEHPGLSGEEKATLCRHLDCRKLSHELCIQAVQNDRMPLRLIVQALFVQQLHTHRAFTECSDSFRCAHSGELVPGAGTYNTPSPGFPTVVPTSQPLSTSSAYYDSSHAPLRGDARLRDDDASDYETASFRIQALEQEIISLKQTLQRHNTLKQGSARLDGKEPSFRVAADAAATTTAAGIRRRAATSGSCIGSMRWGSQRRCASRILRVFARLAVFGRGKSRGKQSKCRAATDQLNSLSKVQLEGTQVLAVTAQFGCSCRVFSFPAHDTRSPVCIAPVQRGRSHPHPSIIYVISAFGIVPLSQSIRAPKSQGQRERLKKVKTITTTASRHRQPATTERRRGEGRQAAKGSIKRRGGDERAVRAQATSPHLAPSPSHAPIEILAGEREERRRGPPDPSSSSPLPLPPPQSTNRGRRRGGEDATMEPDSGKLFVGGISWETDEERLRDYFGRFGEVTEAVIMRDRNTGRARGFGFVVFADAAVAERVTMDKHMIDGRMVEAKKAVPRDDQSIVSKNNGSSIGSPGPGRTRKIFVGGLASNVTEVEFRRYFEQFGVITDVVVMYDHNTQRPRGFGFITYDSEDAVDKALHKNFHELNGKMVEVKRAVPKEQSPGPVTRSPAGGQNYGMSRVHSFLNGFNQGYNPNPIGGYGLRVDGRYGLLTGAARNNGFSSFGPGYGMGMNIESGMSGNFGPSTGFLNSSSGRQIGSFYNGSSNRLGSPIGYVGLNDDSGSILSSMGRNVWGNGNLNYAGNPSNTNSFGPPGTGGGIPGDSISWGGLTSAPGMGNISGIGSGNLGRGAGDGNFGLPSGSYRRSNSTGTIGEQFSSSANVYDSNNTGTYGSNSIYGDTTWRFSSSEVDMPPFGHELGNVDPDIKSEISASYMGSRGITS